MTPAPEVPGTSRRALAAARAAVRGVERYDPDCTPVEVDLGDNTNAWGMPPAAARALAAAAGAGIATRYPTPYGDTVKDAVARWLGVSASEVVTGCGSDDVLDSAVRAFGGPGARLAYSDPTFSMIPVFARLNGLEPVAVPLGEDFDVDADALLATGAEIVYLCSPNNPTGVAVRRAALERIVSEARGLVVVDEAYAEFAGTSLAARAPGLGNVLVTRTLSKAFGLAGLRVGYGIAAPAVVREVEKSRGPYTVGAIAEQVAVAALGEGVAWMEEHAALAVQARRRLAERLRAMGLVPLPSAANFLLVPVPAEPGAVALARRMRAAGVAVRAFPALPVVGDALRFHVAPEPQLERMLAALGEALRGGRDA